MPQAGTMIPPRKRRVGEDCSAPKNPKTLYSAASNKLEMISTGIVFFKSSLATPAINKEASASIGMDRVIPSAQ